MAQPKRDMCSTSKSNEHVENSINFHFCFKFCYKNFNLIVIEKTKKKKIKLNQSYETATSFDWFVIIQRSHQSNVSLLSTF